VSVFACCPGAAQLPLRSSSAVCSSTGLVCVFCMLSPSGACPLALCMMHGSHSQLTADPFQAEADTAQPHIENTTLNMLYELRTNCPFLLLESSATLGPRPMASLPQAALGHHLREGLETTCSSAEVPVLASTSTKHARMFHSYLIHVVSYASSSAEGPLVSMSGHSLPPDQRCSWVADHQLCAGPGVWRREASNIAAPMWYTGGNGA
jgi:hypothetical protein